MKNSQIIFHRFRWVSVLLVIGLISGTSLLTRHSISVTGGIALAAGKVIYTCSMDPQVIQDSPGKCPICGMNLVKKEVPATKKTTASGKTVYTCPMDPQIVQDSPGKCSICGMNLVKNEVSATNKATASGKTVYTCPMDPQIVQDSPGKCSICGMNLEKKETVITETKKPSSPVTQKKDESVGEKKYQCPMHPTIVQDHPGDCPICGMKLVILKGSTEVSDTNTGVDNRTEVTIDPSRQQLIGLRTAPAIRADIHSDWHTVGRVQIDQTKVSKINVKVAGYVERVFVDFVGKSVSDGEPLFTFYSPELLSAQREFLLALKSSRSAGTDPSSDSLMVDVVKQKLRLWDVPEDQIERLEETGEVTKALTFVSPVTGVVTAKEIVEGSSLNPGDTPYEITDLSTVWVMADAYQSDAARVKIGMSATITLESMPDRIFTGKISFVDPVLDPQSRTFKVRINIENHGGEFKPDMFADVVIQGSERETLTIPADAVIPTGRGSMVFVSLGNGKFQPRAIKIGEKSADRVEVKDGISEGESVVMRANFLVDSESSLRAALAAVGGK